MRSWATEELKHAALPDKRLNQRLIKVDENLAQQPHASIPQASGVIGQIRKLPIITCGHSPLWQSERVDAVEIIEAHRKQVAHRASLVDRVTSKTSILNQLYIFLAS